MFRVVNQVSTGAFCIDLNIKRFCCKFILMYFDFQYKVRINSECEDLVMVKCVVYKYEGLTISRDPLSSEIMNYLYEVFAM
jgi:hypothetical protein